MSYALVTSQISDQETHRSVSRTIKLSGADHGENPVVPFDDLTAETVCGWIVDQDDRFIKTHLLKENLMFFLAPKPPEPPKEVVVDAPWATDV